MAGHFTAFPLSQMNCDEALDRFGLPSEPGHREALLVLLEEGRGKAGQGEEDADLLRCLCAQLLSIGDVRDSLPIWRAKSASFDLMCGLDVQFLCGAGVNATRAYLGSIGTKESDEALECLDQCVAAGDFMDWSPEQCVLFYRRYFSV